MPRKVVSSQGLLWWGSVGSTGNIIDVQEADRIAFANDFLCAERVVKAYDGKSFYVGDDYKIVVNSLCACGSDPAPGQTMCVNCLMAKALRSR